MMIDVASESLCITLLSVSSKPASLFKCSQEKTGAKTKGKNKLRLMLSLIDSVGCSEGLNSTLLTTLL